MWKQTSELNRGSPGGKPRIRGSIQKVWVKPRGVRVPVSPVSSWSSRWAAVSGVSPGSTMPVTLDHHTPWLGVRSMTSSSGPWTPGRQVRAETLWLGSGTGTSWKPST